MTKTCKQLDDVTVEVVEPYLFRTAWKPGVGFILEAGYFIHGSTTTHWEYRELSVPGIDQLRRECEAKFRQAAMALAGVVE